MFSREHWQIKLVYTGFGAVLLFIGMLLSPVTAQRDKFGHIECAGLTVVDADGKTMVRLGAGEHGGSVVAFGKDGKPGAALGVAEHGGVVTAFGKDRKSGAMLRVNEHGGSVATFDKAGKLRASLSITEHGGRVQVHGKGEGAAVMGINEYGNGAVSTWDKNGYRQ